MNLLEAAMVDGKDGGEGRSVTCYSCFPLLKQDSNCSMNTEGLECEFGAS